MNAQSLIFRTDDGGTPRTRMSISNAAGTATLLVSKSRVTFDTTAGLIGYLNLPATASTTAGDIWYSGGSVLYRDATGNQTLVTGSTGYLQNGNSYGTGAVLGTNDANSLSFETSGTTRMTLNTSGMLLPAASNTYDFGSTTARWRDVFLDGDVKTSAGTVRYVQNQTAADQAASFRIGGTGQLTNTAVAGGSAVYGESNGAGTGWNVGVEGWGNNATGAGQNYGVLGRSQTSGGIGTRGWFSGAAEGTGVGATNSATGTGGPQYGFRSQVNGALGAVQSKYAAYLEVINTAAVNYGARCLASGATTNYGVNASASGAATTNYGLYATASGGTTDWAGYFVGDVYISGTLSIGGTTDPYVNETGDTMTGDLTMSSADVVLAATTDQLRVSHTSSAYVILMENTTNYGVYWNATSNYFSWYGAGVERARVDLDNGGFQTDGWNSFSSTTDASGTAGSGAVQIGGSLRFDGNEVITNTNTTLYINWDNNGDVRMDSDTFAVDASNSCVQIGNPPAFWYNPLQIDSATAAAPLRCVNTSLLTSQDILILRGGPNTNPGTGVDYVTIFDGDGTTIGSIDGDGAGGVRYNTTSDRRLKQDIVPLADALETLRRLEPREYAFRTNPALRQHGFIAQELQGVYPQAVSGVPDGDVSTDPMLVDYARLTPLLTAGVKELHSLVETQQAEIERLRHDLERVNRRLDALGAR